MEKTFFTESIDTNPSKYMVLIHGGPGSGKTHLGLHLATNDEHTVFDIDKKRAELFGLTETRHPPHIERDIMKQTYEALHAEIDATLADPNFKGIIFVTGVYSSYVAKDNLRNIAIQAQVPLIAFEIIAPEAVMIDRVIQREGQRTLSNIKTPHDLKEIMDRREEHPELPSVKLDGTKHPTFNRQVISSHLEKLGYQETM